VCLADPLCTGFDSTGLVVEGNWSLGFRSGATAWLRVPAALVKVREDGKKIVQ
jgi:hypothetical protein